MSERMRVERAEVGRLKVVDDFPKAAAGVARPNSTTQTGKSLIARVGHRMSLEP